MGILPRIVSQYLSAAQKTRATLLVRCRRTKGQEVISFEIVLKRFCAGSRQKEAEDRVPLASHSRTGVETTAARPSTSAPRARCNDPNRLGKLAGTCSGLDLLGAINTTYTRPQAQSK